MTSSASIVLSLLLGCGVWMGVRLGAGLSPRPGSGWGLKISPVEIARRGMWVLLVAMASIPVYLGLANSAAYQQMLVPMLTGMAAAEMAVSRWERFREKQKQNRRPRKKRRSRPANNQAEE